MLDEELQATGCTSPTSQPGNQILPLFPAAHRMGTSAAENLIRYAESERNVKRFHVKTQPFLLTVAAENTAHFTHIMFCHYVMSSCQIAKRDEEDYKQRWRVTELWSCL